MKNDKIMIGTFVKTRGLKGEMILLSYTQKSMDFLNYEKYFIKTPAGYQELKILKKQHYKGNRFVLKLSQVEDFDTASKLVNQEVFIKADELEDLKEGEFYFYDAVDSEVFVGPKKIGKVISVNNFGSCDVLEVELDENKKLVYLPVLNDYLDLFDIKNKKIVYQEIDDLF